MKRQQRIQLLCCEIEKYQSHKATVICYSV